MNLDFKKSEIGNKRIMIRIEDENYKAVKKIAKENNQAMGQVIRIIIKNYLENKEN